MADLKSKFESLFMGDQQPDPVQPPPTPPMQQLETDRERYARLCMQRAVFIRQSSLKRAEINHSLNRGDPPDKTLLIALECIAAMTGDAMAVRIYADRHRAAQDAQQPLNDDNTH